MAVTERIKGMLNSPRARQLIERGRQQASKPATQQKLRQLASRVKEKAAPRR